MIHFKSFEASDKIWKATREINEIFLKLRNDKRDPYPGSPYVIEEMLKVGDKILEIKNFLNWRSQSVAEDLNDKIRFIDAKKKTVNAWNLYKKKHTNETAELYNEAKKAMDSIVWEMNNKQKPSRERRIAREKFGLEMEVWYCSYLKSIETKVPENLKTKYQSALRMVKNSCTIRAALGLSESSQISLINAFPVNLEHQGRFIIGRAIAKKTGERTYFLFDVSDPPVVEPPFIGTAYDTTDPTPFPVITVTKPLSRSQFVRMLCKTVSVVNQ